MGLTRDSGLLHIKEVRGIAKSRLTKTNRPGMLAAKVQQLEQIAHNIIASGRENNMIDTIRFLSKFVGLSTAEQRERKDQLPLIGRS